MKNLFDAMGETYRSFDVTGLGELLFGGKKRRHHVGGRFFIDEEQDAKEKRRQAVKERLQRAIVQINEKDLIRYAKYRDKEKSIFNPRNASRWVEYKTERFYLLDRDGWSCVYCRDSQKEKESKENPLQPDHIIPYKTLPATHIDNLAMACRECNMGKSGLLLSKESLYEILFLVYSRNEQHFPKKKFGAYRREYWKLVK